MLWGTLLSKQRFKIPSWCLSTVSGCQSPAGCLTIFERSTETQKESLPVNKQLLRYPNAKTYRLTMAAGAVGKSLQDSWWRGWQSKQTPCGLKTKTTRLGILAGREHPVTQAAALITWLPPATRCCFWTFVMFIIGFFSFFKFAMLLSA